MPFRNLIDRRRREARAHALYVAVVEQSRQPVFYATLGVPDTLEGRFDLIILHAFLVMRRLGQVEGTGGEEAKALSQALFDLMFADMDQNLREMGVTDLRVGKRVQKMAEDFYGRVSAYEMALAEGGDAMAEALARNVLCRPMPEVAARARALADYVRREDASLAGQEGVPDGKVAFGSVEAP